MEAMGRPAWEGAGEVGGVQVLQGIVHGKESEFSPNCRRTFEGI